MGNEVGIGSFHHCHGYVETSRKKMKLETFRRFFLRRNRFLTDISAVRNSKKSIQYTTKEDQLAIVTNIDLEETNNRFQFETIHQLYRDNMSAFNSSLYASTKWTTSFKKNAFSDYLNYRCDEYSLSNAVARCEPHINQALLEKMQTTPKKGIWVYGPPGTDTTEEDVMDVVAPKSTGPQEAHIDTDLDTTEEDVMDVVAPKSTGPQEAHIDTDVDTTEENVVDVVAPKSTGPQEAGSRPLNSAEQLEVRYCLMTLLILTNAKRAGDITHLTKEQVVKGKSAKGEDLELLVFEHKEAKSGKKCPIRVTGEVLAFLKNCEGPRMEVPIELKMEVDTGAADPIIFKAAAESDEVWQKIIAKAETVIEEDVVEADQAVKEDDAPHTKTAPVTRKAAKMIGRVTDRACGIARKATTTNCHLTAVKVLVAHRADNAGAPGSGENRDPGRCGPPPPPGRQSEACYPAGIPAQLGWIPVVPCRKDFLGQTSALRSDQLTTLAETMKTVFEHKVARSGKICRIRIDSDFLGLLKVYATHLSQEDPLPDKPQPYLFLTSKGEFLMPSLVQTGELGSVKEQGLRRPPQPPVETGSWRLLPSESGPTERRTLSLPNT
ncbi:unnamed protein product [Mytilus coruscus]|uniref:Uncharacterized protein n=1 Tax=Mytilus coruscus TaxID=42192 RepID=A0A6J8CBC3_MYTCO|nr:unnamed protein product [Mytilus coruscus]